MENEVADLVDGFDLQLYPWQERILNFLKSDDMTRFMLPSGRVTATEVSARSRHYFFDDENLLREHYGKGAPHPHDEYFPLDMWEEIE